MNLLLTKTLEAIRNSYNFALKYGSLAAQWKLKFVKIRWKKWKRCGAQKELDKAYGRLGAEIFALYEGGHTEWQQMPLVEQKLKMVEKAEAKLFAVDEDIEAIASQYRAKKELIGNKYRREPSKSGGAVSEEE